MKITFLLLTKDGPVGDFYYDWQCPFVPRVGEYVHIENLYDDGKFIVSKDDNIESKVDDIEYFIKSASWKVKSITWCKKEEYSLIMSLRGE